jgi:hypothetical protein
MEKGKKIKKDRVQAWMKISKKFMDYVFFDDTNPNHIKTIVSEFSNTKLKLFSISPIDLEKALSIIHYEPNIYYVNQFNYNECVRMLEERLKLTIQRKEDKNSIVIYCDSLWKRGNVFRRGVKGAKMCGINPQLVKKIKVLMFGIIPFFEPYN